MSFNRLVVQGLSSYASQRAAQALAARRLPEQYRGMAGLGDVSSRPSIDYVKAGDVIRVYIAISPGFYFGGANESAKFAQEVAKSFNVVRAPSDASGFFGSQAWVVDVQPRSDYSQLRDAVSVVLHAAQESGLNVNAGTSYGQFVSKVESTGGTPPVDIQTPGANSGSGAGDAIGNFFSNLTQSPTTLAVILGAAVILVIAAKK
jgi:hypothetical protein